MEMKGKGHRGKGRSREEKRKRGTGWGKGKPPLECPYAKDAFGNVSLLTDPPPHPRPHHMAIGFPLSLIAFHPLL